MVVVTRAKVYEMVCVDDGSCVGVKNERGKTLTWAGGVCVSRVEVCGVCVCVCVVWRCLYV